LDLYKADVSIELLIESGIGKTVKYFIDYCKVYQSDLGGLQRFISLAEQIQQKWKNYVSNTLFDEKKEQTEFMKPKYLKKAEKKC